MSSSTPPRSPPSAASSFSQFTSTSSAPVTSTSPKTCGWRYTSFLDEALRDLVDVPSALVGGHLRMEHHLKQHVAELVAHRIVVAGVDRLEQLVRLLEQVTRERLMCLLGVPRAPARTAEPRHHAHEVEQPPALLRTRNRALGNVGEQVARARGRLGHGAGVPSSPSLAAPSAGALDALGSVLFTATTVRVETSKLPYFGFTSTP